MKILITLTCIAAYFTSFSQNIPVDFETGGNGANWTWAVFENDDNPALEIVANPDASGINTSATVAKFTARAAGQPYAGCESLHGSDIGTFKISESNKIIRIMVWKNRISDVGIKLVTASSASLGEIKVANTKIGEWEQITFDFSAHVDGMEYDQIVIFPDFMARESDEVIYFDNVYGAAEGTASVEEAIPTEISLFPNPTVNEVTIESNVKMEEISVVDVQGKLIQKIDLSSNTASVSLFDLPKGMYFLHIKQADLYAVRKITKL